MHLDVWHVIELIPPSMTVVASAMRVVIVCNVHLAGAVALLWQARTRASGFNVICVNWHVNCNTFRVARMW